MFNCLVIIWSKIVFFMFVGYDIENEIVLFLGVKLSNMVKSKVFKWIFFLMFCNFRFFFVFFEWILYLIFFESKFIFELWFVIKEYNKWNNLLLLKWNELRCLVMKKEEN